MYHFAVKPLALFLVLLALASNSHGHEKPINAVDYQAREKARTNGLDILKLFVRAGSLSDSVKKVNSKLDSLSESLDQTNQALDKNRQSAEKSNTVTKGFIDKFWVLLAAMLVFFMQAGFKCLEVGMARRDHDASTAVMNLMNWLILCVVFYFIGYGIMFGKGGLFFSDFQYWGPPTSNRLSDYSDLGLEHFLFQLAFAGTAATIVDGAILERTSLFSYFFLTIVVGLLVYPVFGYWAWNKHGWLTNIGFLDFAGSTVVHSIGAWCALVAIWYIGPRRFRFNEKAPDFKKNTFKPYSLGYSVLGVIMLWFGWWGFNGGSQLKYDETIASIILHTNLAGASAGIIAFFDAYYRDKEHLYEKIIGGVLGGLVAITASCNLVTPGGSVVIGVIAGFVHNAAYDLLVKKKIDDVAGAIPVHGACGVLGTFLAGIVPFLFTGVKPPNGSIGTQLLVQLLGISVALVFTTLVTALCFWIIEKTIGFRSPVTPEEMQEEVNHDVDDNYHGNIRISERAYWFNRPFAWKKFIPWPRFAENNQNPLWTSFVEKLSNYNNVNKGELIAEFKELQQHHFQFIRDDDMTASLFNVRFASVKKSQVFINYRQKDTSAVANLIHTKLTLEYGENNDMVFIDSGIEYGSSIPADIKLAIDTCKVFIVVIGPKWEAILADRKGKQDFVVQEIEMALQKGKKIIPVLVDDATSPTTLPPEIQALSECLAIDARGNPTKTFFNELFMAIRPYIPVSKKKK